MSNCPECNKTMGLHDLFVAGFCPSCAGEYITYQAKRIAELEDIYLGQIRVIVRSRITHKEKVERMAALAEQALKGE